MRNVYKNKIPCKTAKNTHFKDDKASSEVKY